MLIYVVKGAEIGLGFEQTRGSGRKYTTRSAGARHGTSLDRTYNSPAA